MRYNSRNDTQWLKRRALGPAAAAQQRNFAMAVPGRGQAAVNMGQGARTTLRGFGALGTSYAPPVGAGAGAGAEIGASQGAAIGSAIVPGIGTAIGAVIGAVGGAIAGAFGKKDQEVQNFDQAVALWQSNPNLVYDIANKYLVLAGLFDLDLKNPHIPIYQKYGRMGEQRFVTDMVNLIYSAAQQGRITTSDTPQSVMSKIVQPWIDGFGFGQMNDPHGDMITRVLIGMILDYVTGGQRAWLARGGDYPFASLPTFALPQAPAAQPQQTASPTPSPQATNGPPAGFTAIGQAPANQVGYAGMTIYSRAGDATLYVFPQGFSGNPMVYQYPQAATTPTVSTTPPNQIGTPITYAMDSATGQMIGLPSTATFQGFTPGGAWIVGFKAVDGSTALYTVVNGVLTPYVTTPVAQQKTQAPPADTTQTQQAAVSTTPPAIGAALSYVKDNSTGQMVSIPAGGVYAGLTTTNGWLVTYPAGGSVPAGTYASNNGVLTVQGSAANGSAIPPGYTANGQTVILNGTAYPLYQDSLGALYVWTGGNMVPYSAASTTGVSSTSGGGGGGGGGGGYYAPQSYDTGAGNTTIPDSSSSVISAGGFLQTALGNPTVLIVGGVLAYLLLGKKGVASK